ncbi:hypothetical protein ABK040_007714 [Willaertia magna]
MINTKTKQSKGHYVKCKTCFGDIELSYFKLFAIGALILNTFVFFLLFAFIIATYAENKKIDMNLVILGKDLVNYENLRTNSLFLAAYSLNLTYLDQLERYDSEEDETIQKLLLKLPSDKAIEFNETTTSAESELDEHYEAVEELIKDGKSKEAVVYLEENKNFLGAKRLYQEGIDSVMQYIIDIQQNASNIHKIFSLICLIICGSAIIAFLPAVTLIFGFAINRDGIYNKRWKKAKALLLIDTLHNDRLRHLFKDYCKQEHSIENYSFLEEVQEYKHMCDETIEMQMRFFEVVPSDNTKNPTGPTASVQSPTTSSHSSHSSHSKESIDYKPVTEQELEDLENRKYEKALNIYKKYLSMEGEMTINVTKRLVTPIKERLDLFEKKILPMLPEELFRNLESEISIVMLDTHHRFKESIAFKKEMKIEKIKSHFKTDINSVCTQ